MFRKVDSRHLYYLREVSLLTKNLTCPQSLQCVTIAESGTIGRRLGKMFKQRDDRVLDLQIDTGFDVVYEVRCNRNGGLDQSRGVVLWCSMS